MKVKYVKGLCDCCNDHGPCLIVGGYCDFEMRKTIDEIGELFDKHKSEYRKFSRINEMRSFRPDVHAFMLLDHLFPPGGRWRPGIISGKAHDQIWLDITEDEICSLSEENIIELSRCGVFFDVFFDDGDGYGALSMF